MKELSIAERGRPWLWSAFAAAVTVGQAAALPAIGRTVEDFTWEAFFVARGPVDLWCTSHGSYRPLCGLLLIAEADWPAWLALAASWALHLGVVFSAGALAYRLAGARAATLAGAGVAVWSTQCEVTLWLGGRCELLWVLPGLLATHSFLSATRRGSWGWSLLAAGLAGCAALGKEPGFLLPLAFVAVASPTDSLRNLAKWLAPTVVVLAVLLLARTALLAGPGAYAGFFLRLGPRDWAGNLAHGWTKLALGAVVRWPNELAVGVTLLGLAALAVAAMRVRGRGPWIAVAGFLAFLAPTALVHAPRALYGPLAYLSVLGAVAIMRCPRRQRWEIVITVALFLQAAATLSSQRVFVHFAEQREALATQVRHELWRGRHVLLLGHRILPCGVPVADVGRALFAGRPVDPLLPVHYAENAWSSFREASLLGHGSCQARFRYEIPAGPRRLPDGVSIRETSEGVIEVAVERPTTIFYGHGSEVRSLFLPCARDSSRSIGASREGEASPHRKPHADLAPEPVPSSRRGRRAKWVSHGCDSSARCAHRHAGATQAHG